MILPRTLDNALRFIAKEEPLALRPDNGGLPCPNYMLMSRWLLMTESQQKAMLAALGARA